MKVTDNNNYFVTEKEWRSWEQKEGHLTSLVDVKEA